MGNRITAIAILGAVIGALVIMLAFQVDAPPRTPEPVGVLPPPAPLPTPGFPWTPPSTPLPPSPEPGEPGIPQEPPSEPMPPPAPQQPVPNPPPTTPPPGGFPPPAAQLLPLPAVSDSELAISPNGASTLAAYLEQLAVRGSELAFDGAKIEALPKNTGNFPLLVSDLVEAAIRTGSFTGVRAPLATYEELITAKIAWEKTIPVQGNAVAVNKIIIGSDLLALDLIQKAYAVADNALTRSAFEDHYGRYQKTIDFYRRELRRGASVSYLAPERGVSEFEKFFRVLGLSPEIARAIGLQFGGLITAQFNCTCTGGYTIILTPAYAPVPVGTAIFFYYYWFLGSPLLFLNHAPFPGHWILGAYLPSPGTCRKGGDCDPFGPNPFIGVIEMAGTS